ncbi:MAG TPA: hypothetical protein VGE74_15820 [Gemmata sp.]
MFGKQRDATVRGSWAVCVASVGLLLVGMVYGCIWYAIPDRPVAREWPVYGPLLLAPYALAALGCWFSPNGLARALAALIVLAGVMVALVALYDAWPTFCGGPAPGMPASALVSGVLLVCQYWAGVAAMVSGLAGRHKTPDPA